MSELQAVPDQAMSSNSGRMPISWINRIFQRMTAMYGSLFLDMWSSDIDTAMACWAEALEGYSAEEIAAGLNACKGRQYPPTLPAFLMMCRRPVDPEWAFREAVRCMAKRGTGLEEWPSPAIYWAAVKFGHFELMNGAWDVVKKRWTLVLEEMLADQNLPPIPDRHFALPEPGRTMMREGGIKKILDAQPSADRAGNGWAVKLFKRWENGERVNDYAMRAAEEALGRSRPVRPLKDAA